VQSPFDPNEKINFIPSKSLYLPISRDRILSTGTVEPEKAQLIVDTMKWRLGSNMILKEGLVVLDLLSTNNWERPIYMGTTVSNESYQNLEKYFQLEGLMYRIVPIAAKASRGGYGMPDTKLMYDNLMHKYRFRSIADPNIYIDENSHRIISNYRNIFGRLAQALAEEGKKEQAVEVLDRCMEAIPTDLVTMNYFGLYLIEGYYKAGAIDKAVTYSTQMMNQAVEMMNYIVNDLGTTEALMNDIQINMAILQDLYRMAATYERGEHKNLLEKEFGELVNRLNANG
jgi:tetratricopeptide (TPR) repeat protein